MELICNRIPYLLNIKNWTLVQTRDLLNGIRHIKYTIHTTWLSKPNFSMQATQTQMSAQDTTFADMHICQTNDSSSLVAGSTSPL